MDIAELWKWCKLWKLLFELGASGSDIMMCIAEELIDIHAEKWTESSESDAVLHECDDPTGADAADDDSIER